MLSKILDRSAVEGDSRACFLLHVKPERLEEYISAHQSVWPEMLSALEASGWRNYSLFLEADTGLVVGYFESNDTDMAVSAQSSTDVDKLWQKAMSEYFDSPTNGEPKFLKQYFHLP